MRTLSIGLASLLATAVLAATLEDRGDVPRDAWMRLGPESKEAFILGMVWGVDEAADVAGEDVPNRKRFSAVDIARLVDEYYEADAEHRFVPWRQVCVGALREAGVPSTQLTPVEEIDEGREQAAAAWLAAHPAIARRARDPDATRPPSLPTGRPADPCLEFHRWLLEGLALGAADPDAPLAMQLARDSVEVAGGFARVTDRAATEREGHEWADIRVEWTASDSTDCSAIVVFIDGIPTRVDGVPSGTRRRFR